MTDQISTPGSNAESSINISKTGAPKDKSCPFCQQPFTSSSLGRHLDLYIREKNPKPADEVHNVEEIKKLRQGITRRQPRNSTSKREGSTSSAAPIVNGGNNEKRSPRSEADKRDGRDHEIASPPIRRQPMDLNVEAGVINDIPPISQNGDSEKWDQEAEDRAAQNRATESRRTFSRQTLAKATFDLKQKTAEAADNARAAELALREVLGSIRAANRRVKPSTTPFNYDPLSLGFPALTLHCLPPPPTLNQQTVIPSPGSWSIAPPEDQQYEALRSHFRESFHSWRISRAVTSSAHPDELLLYPSDLSRTSEEEAETNAAAQDLEEKISNHLLSAFSQWSSLSSPLKEQIWRTELARAVGRKNEAISSLESNREKILQENAHLRTQVEQLSRCQQPREFQMMPPATLPISTKVAVELSEMGMHGEVFGVTLSDKDEPIEGVVKKSIGRWLSVVRSSRANSGMGSQRPLDSPVDNHQRQLSLSQIQNETRGPEVRVSAAKQDIDIDMDADGDADADGEEHFDTPAGGPGPRTVLAPEAPMGIASERYGNLEVTNGNGNSNTDRDAVNGLHRGGRVLR